MASKALRNISDVVSCTARGPQPSCDVKCSMLNDSILFHSLQTLRARLLSMAREFRQALWCFLICKIKVGWLTVSEKAMQVT